jgi:excisionase family DNA binding protein
VSRKYIFEQEKAFKLPAITILEVMQVSGHCFSKEYSGHVLDINQAASYLRVHKSTLYRLAENGRLPAAKVGGSWRFRRRLLDELFGCGDMDAVLQENLYPEIMDVKQASDYLHVRMDTLYKLARKGRVPAVKIGRQWRFKKSVLDDMFERPIS